MNSASAASRMRDLVSPACRPVVRTAMLRLPVAGFPARSKRFKWVFETDVFQHKKRWRSRSRGRIRLTPLEDPMKRVLVSRASRQDARKMKKAGANQSETPVAV